MILVKLLAFRLTREIKMKKFIAICFGFLGFAKTLFASDSLEEAKEILNQYGYVNLGLGPLPFPVPTLGGGYRRQRNQHGLDLNASAVIVAPERVGVKWAGRYLHYFSPNLDRQFYLGAGPSISSIFVYGGARWSGLGVSPEFLFGREYRTYKGKTRFWEVVVDFPTYASNDNVYKWGNDGHFIYFPYVYAQYGWGF